MWGRLYHSRYYGGYNIPRPKPAFSTHIGPTRAKQEYGLTDADLLQIPSHSNMFGMMFYPSDIHAYKEQKKEREERELERQHGGPEGLAAFRTQ